VRIEVSPRTADVRPGIALPLSITISNTDTVIGGYVIRLLGADQSWVELEADQVSLFPDEQRTIGATVTVPQGIPAGKRRIAVQVRELTEPFDSSVAEIDLNVPAAPMVTLRLDPTSVTAGRRGGFSLVIENAGNTQSAGRLAADDPEGKVGFQFTPDRVTLAPGEHAVVDMRASGPRPFVGTPAVRVLSIYLDDAPADAFFDAPAGDQPAARNERTALALGTFVQRPWLSRGPISLLGLLAAVTVFAVVLTIALSKLVGQSAADRDLALQVAQARNATASGGTSGLAGTVRLLTSGTPVSGVAVNVFTAADTTTPVDTTATDSKGAYSVGNLAAGDYKVSFRGAGFVQLWYPGGATDADATTVTLKEGQTQTGLDVRLGGVPASISGTIVGDDVSTATLYLETSSSAPATATSSAKTVHAANPPNAPPNNNEAVVRTVPIGSDGTFTLTDVPSPSIYDLVVSKTGYATSTQRIDVGAGETRTGVEVRLEKGDGLISGHVNSITGPLGGVTITATSGQNTANTVSLTADDIGAFTLRSLPTPASFTIVASDAGYTSQTLTLTLAAGQKLTGVAITLGQAAGKLTGKVTAAGAPAAGVSVTVTDGQSTVQTVTESTGHPGTWQVGGLAIPGTYTVTFARTDLASQTVSIALDAGGNITPGSQGATVTSDGISIAMQSATAVVYGTVSQHPDAGATATALGNASVVLNSGTTSYTVSTASVNTSTGRIGGYRIENITPGTYTLTVSGNSGTSPRSNVVILAAGQQSQQNVVLDAPAALIGTVVGTNGTIPRAGWTVLIYEATQYPATIYRTTITDTTGAFSFTDIAAGNYVIEVRPTAGSAATGSANVTVTPSQQSQTVPLVIKADASG
jgi:5-hydroxyisourate hydrolase-like protein (transthyretin family)